MGLALRDGVQAYHINNYLIYFDGVWLSLARVPDLGSGGRRFKSCHPDFWLLNKQPFFILINFLFSNLIQLLISVSSLFGREMLASQKRGLAYINGKPFSILEAECSKKTLPLDLKNHALPKQVHI